MINKFRAWIKSKQTMEKVLEIKWNKNQQLIAVTTESDTYNADQVELMACLGTFNGQELYEEDIIWCPWNEDSASIEWDQEDFCFDFDWICGRFTESMQEWNQDMQIVGNIYEPQELEEEEE